jgi:hypothetical protein
MPDLWKRVYPVCVHKVRHANRATVPHPQITRRANNSDLMKSLPRHRTGFYSFVGIALVAAVVLTIF